MRKSSKRKIYRELNKLFGSPVAMRPEVRKQMFNLLGGWLGQRTGQRSDYWWYEYEVALKRRPYSRVRHGKNFVDKHGEIALASFLCSYKSHWNIIGRPHLKSKTIATKSLSDTSVKDWKHLVSLGRKSFEIAIAVNYHLTVAAHGVQKDGRKFVQRIWDHRIYTDREVWCCYFWDMEKLTKDENSWRNITWHEGYVVKSQGHVAVDASLSKAVSLAQRRVVSAGIKSILGDFDDQEEDRQVR